MKSGGVSATDLLTIIEDVGFGTAVIGGADSRGIIVDGYLDLAAIAKHINHLIAVRNRSLHRGSHADFPLPPSRTLRP